MKGRHVYLPEPILEKKSRMFDHCDILMDASDHLILRRTFFSDINQSDYDKKRVCAWIKSITDHAMNYLLNEHGAISQDILDKFGWHASTVDPCELVQAYVLHSIGMMLYAKTREEDNDVPEPCLAAFISSNENVIIRSYYDFKCGHLSQEQLEHIHAKLKEPELVDESSHGVNKTSHHDVGNALTFSGLASVLSSQYQALPPHVRLGLFGAGALAVGMGFVLLSRDDEVILHKPEDM